MNARTMAVVSALLLSSGIGLASDQAQEHKAHDPNSGTATDEGASAMPGGGMSMHEQMQKMQAQMAEIHRTKDPDKRDALIQSHMADMQNMMKMMQGMHGAKPMKGPGGMMGPGMGMQGGKMMGGPPAGKMAVPQGGMAGGPPAVMMEMMDRQRMMEQRMGMMQMMMDQMMQNQAAMEDTRIIRKRRHEHTKMK